MTTYLTRRAALTAAAALPLLPIAASATVANAATPNATDAAWAELESARVSFSEGVNAIGPDEDDDPLHEAARRIGEAETAALAMPAATLTDLERKVSILAGCELFDEARPGVMRSVLSDVRCLAGSGAA